MVAQWQQSGENQRRRLMFSGNWTGNGGALTCSRCPEPAENSTPPSRRKWRLKLSRSNARSRNLLRNLKSTPTKSTHGSESFWSEATKFLKVTKTSRGMRRLGTKPSLGTAHRPLDDEKRYRLPSRIWLPCAHWTSSIRKILRAELDAFASNSRSWDLTWGVIKRAV